MPKFRECCFSSLHVSRHILTCFWNDATLGLNLNLLKLRHSLVLFPRIGAWHLVFKRSRTSPSAVLCNSSLYFIKCKIARASELCLYMAAQRGLVCLQRLLVYSSLYFVNASLKHVWMVFKKNGLFWLNCIFISKALGLPIYVLEAVLHCSWKWVRRNSSPCCVPRLLCCVTNGEGTGQMLMQVLVWRWTQRQQLGQSL